MTTLHRRTLLSAATFGMLLLALAWPANGDGSLPLASAAQPQDDTEPPPPTPDLDSDAPPRDAAGFVNVGQAAGLGDRVAGGRCQWVDLNGDGWLDVLVIDNGRRWLADFYVANELPDGLPLVAEGEPDQRREIRREDWPGEPVAFATYDLNADSLLTGAEMRTAGLAHAVRLYQAVPVHHEGDASPPGCEAWPVRYVDVSEASGIWANTRGTADNPHADTGSGRLTSLVLAADIDHDGDLDLFAGASNDLENPAAREPDLGDRSIWLLNDGSGVFTPYAQPIPARDEDGDLPAGAILGPNAFPSTLAAACVVDVDNDGHLDLYTGSWYRKYGVSYDAYADRLYLGGRGPRGLDFEEVTEAFGMMLEAGPFDRISTEQHTGEEEIDDATRDAIGRHSHRPTYGVAHADWDGNGQQDLFALAYGRQWNLHWHSGGPLGFYDTSPVSRFDGDMIRHGQYPQMMRDRGREDELPFRANGNTFSVDFGDLDNDGDLDAILGEIKHAWAGDSSDPTSILLNQTVDLVDSGDGQDEDNVPAHFQRQPAWQLRRTHEVQWWNQGDMSVALADLDHDGLLDAIVSSSDYPDDQRLRVFLQDPTALVGAPKFVDVTERLGLDWPASTQISLGDADRDGDLDILVGNTHTRLPGPIRDGIPLGTAIWRNDIANGRSFLSLELQGRAQGRPAGEGQGGANAMAVGATVRVTVRLSPAADPVTLMRYVKGGHGHAGQQDDQRLLFGLADATVIDRIEIAWGGRAGTVETFEAVAPNRFLRAIEGAGTFETAPRLPAADRG